MFFNKPKISMATQAWCKGQMQLNNGSKSINTCVFRQGVDGVKLLQNYVENREETCKERASYFPQDSMAENGSGELGGELRWPINLRLSDPMSRGRQGIQSRQARQEKG